jgi:NADH:ubiquinone oxidoreductase subunit K
MITLTHYLVLSAILFCIGVYGALTRRNAVWILMSIEIILNAVNLNLIAFSRYVTPFSLGGQIFALFVITVAAAEACLGLAIVLVIYRNMRTVQIDRINLMKW